MSRSTAPTRTPARRVLATLTSLVIGVLVAVVPATAASAAGTVEGRLVNQLDVPVLGLEIEIWGSTLIETLESDPVTGEFALSAPVPDGSYYYWVHDGAMDDAGAAYDLKSESFFVTGGDVDLGDIEVAQYVTVSGTITNYSGDVRVQLHRDYSGSWQQETNETFSGGSFSISAPIYDTDYTLRFLIDDESVPYLDAFLGGVEFDDPALATHLDGVPGVGFSALSMTLPDAAVISGTVTSGGLPLSGIDVEAENADFTDYALDTTDAVGAYTLYVRPGEEYVVYTYGDALHAGMTYDGFDCGCSDFTPVVATLGTPADGIDFDLVPEVAIDLLGVVIEPDLATGSPVEGLNVKLYKFSVGGVWVLYDDFVSVPGGPNFGFTLTSTGEYRVQFVDATGRVLQVVEGLTGTSSGGPDPLDPAPACYAELGSVADHLFVVAAVDLATLANVCAALAAAVPPTTPGGTVVKRPTASAAAVVATPTPTPTPTASPTSTPRPSTTPGPEETAAPEPAPASAPDLWWLLWVVFGVVVVAIVGGVIWFARRS